LRASWFVSDKVARMTTQFRTAGGRVGGSGSAWRRHAWRAVLLGSTALLPTAALVPAALAQAPQARPTGGQVVAGNARIAQNPSRTTINQTSQRAAIDWTSFDVGRQHSVTINQPSTRSWTLNRVTGPDPSRIAGQITAPGGVAIVNQSGVVFAQGSQVNVGSLIASAANITNGNFMSGRMVFDGAPSPGARVENHGTVTVADRGIAVLAGPGVTNTGTIQARLGKIALAGAETYSLDLAGDGLLSIDVTRAVRQGSLGETALVTNSGVLDASGGTVLLTAHAASGLVEDLVRNSGRLAANTDAMTGQTGEVAVRAVGGNAAVTGVVVAKGGAGQRGGRVALEARGGRATVAEGAVIDASGQAGGGSVRVGGATTREARVAGRATASGTGGGARGGTVAVQAADSVTVAATGRVDASGQAGGGTALIGTTGVGRQQAMARRTTVARGAEVRADATAFGTGGTVVVNGAERTEMRGTLSARGGSTGGNGGFIEISAMDAMRIDGQADVQAPAGAAGTVSIDPQSIAVVAVLPEATAPDQNQDIPLPTQITAVTADGGTLNVLNTDVNGFAGTLRLDALTNVTVNAGIAMTGTSSLTIAAGGAVVINAGIAVPGDITITGNTVTSTAGATLTAGAGAAHLVSLRGNTITLGATVTAAAGTIELGPRTAGAAFAVTLPTPTALVAPSIVLGRTQLGDRVLTGPTSWTPSSPGVLGAVTATTTVTPPALTTPAGGTLEVVGGSITVANALTSAGGAIELTASTGDIAQTAVITAPALTATADGAIALTLANPVSSFTGSARTTLAFTSANALTVAGAIGTVVALAAPSLSLTGAVGGSTSVALTATTGAIGQTGDGLITTPALTTNAATGAIDLALANPVSSFTGSAGTTLAFTSANALTVLAADGTVVGLSAPSLLVTGAVTATTLLTLEADELDLQARLSAPGGTIRLRTATRGQAITLGADAAGTFALDGVEIGLIGDLDAPPARLRIGSDTAGAITIASDLDLRTLPVDATGGDAAGRRVATLELVSGGTITQNAGTRINVEQIAASASSSIELSSVAGTAAALNAIDQVVSGTGDGTLMVAGAERAGLRLAQTLDAQSITLGTFRDLTIAADVTNLAAAGSTESTTISIAVGDVARRATLTVGEGATLRTDRGGITLTANGDVTVQAGSVVRAENAAADLVANSISITSSSGGIVVGGTTLPVATLSADGSLLLDASGGIDLSAARLGAGASGSLGALLVRSQTADVALGTSSLAAAGTGGTITLSSAGFISQTEGGSLSADSLRVLAGLGATLDSSGNQAVTLAALVSTAGEGDFVFRNGRSLSVDSVATPTPLDALVGAGPTTGVEAVRGGVAIRVVGSDNDLVLRGSVIARDALTLETIAGGRDVRIFFGSTALSRQGRVVVQAERNLANNGAIYAGRAATPTPNAADAATENVVDAAGTLTNAGLIFLGDPRAAGFAGRVGAAGGGTVANQGFGVIVAGTLGQDRRAVVNGAQMLARTVAAGTLENQLGASLVGLDGVAATGALTNAGDIRSSTVSGGGIANRATGRIEAETLTGTGTGVDLRNAGTILAVAVGGATTVRDVLNEAGGQILANTVVAGRHVVNLGAGAVIRATTVTAGPSGEVWNAAGAIIRDGSATAAVPLSVPIATGAAPLPEGATGLLGEADAANLARAGTLISGQSGPVAAIVTTGEGASLVVAAGSHVQNAGSILAASGPAGGDTLRVFTSSGDVRNGRGITAPVGVSGAAVPSGDVAGAWILAETGRLTISASGAVRNAGTIYAAATADGINTGSTVVGAAGISNRGVIVLGDPRVSGDAGSVTGGTGGIANDAAGAVLLAGTIGAIDGDLTNRGSVGAEAIDAASLTNQAGGSVTVLGTLTAAIGVSNGAGATLLADRIEGGGILGNAGTIRADAVNVTGNVSVGAGGLLVATTIETDGTVGVAGGVVQAGSLTAGSIETTAAGSLIAATSVRAQSGDVTNAVGARITEGSATSETVAFQVQGLVAGADARLRALEASSLQPAPALTGSAGATATAGNSLVVQASRDVSNRGEISAATTLTVNAGRLVSLPAATAVLRGGGDVLVTGQQGVATAGTIQAGGTTGTGSVTLVVDAGDFVQTDGDIAAGIGSGRVGVTAWGDLRQTGGTITAPVISLDAGGSIFTDPANPLAGLIADRVDATRAAAGDVSIRIRGALSSDRTVVVGDHSAAGSYTVSFDRDLQFDAARVSALAGELRVQGTGSVFVDNGTSLTAPGRIFVQGGTTTAVTLSALRAETIVLAAGAAGSEGVLVVDSSTLTAGTAVLLAAGGEIMVAGSLVAPGQSSRTPVVMFETRRTPTALRDIPSNMTADTVDRSERSVEQQRWQVNSFDTAGRDRLLFGRDDGGTGQPSSTPGGRVTMDLDAGNSPVFLLLDGGTATGTLTAGRLGVHGLPGTADGLVAGVDLRGQLNGNAERIAAQYGRATAEAPRDQTAYRFNDCVIGSINCVGLPLILVVTPPNLNSVALSVQRNTLNPADVTIANFGESDYE